MITAPKFSEGVVTTTTTPKKSYAKRKNYLKAAPPPFFEWIWLNLKASQISGKIIHIMKNRRSVFHWLNPEQMSAFWQNLKKRRT